MTRIGPPAAEPSTVFPNNRMHNPAIKQRAIESSFASLQANNDYSWGSLLLDVILFVPKMLWKGICTFVYLISCCKLCSSNADPRELRKGLRNVIEKLQDHVSTIDEAKGALEGFFKKFPGQKEILIRANLEQQRTEDLPPAPKEDIIERWNKENEERERDNIMRLFDRVAEEDRAEIISLLQHCVNILDGQIEYDGFRGSNES
ncbi:MAG: hypothetical protein KR126chlam1_01063 [Chlamydiae bacterium]|nr:hypothetical protein [Chlamydiota bacterium]